MGKGSNASSMQSMRGDNNIYLLLDGCIMLNGEDSLALLQLASLATISGSLKKGSMSLTGVCRIYRVTNLILDTASLHLVSEDLSTGLFGFRLVDIFHKNTLVLEDITL